VPADVSLQVVGAVRGCGARALKDQFLHMTFREHPEYDATELDVRYHPREKEEKRG